MIAGRLTMCAHVERNQATAKDAWGNPVAPDFAPIGEAACFIWSTRASETRDGNKSIDQEDMRGLFSLAADLKADDVIASITDRSGNVIIPGRLRVMGPVQRKHTHVEADLRRIA